MLLINKKLFVFSLIITFLLTLLSYFFFDHYYKNTHLVTIELDKDKIINKKNITINHFEELKLSADSEINKKIINIENHYVTDAFHRYGIKNARFAGKSFYLIEATNELDIEIISEIKDQIYSIYLNKFNEDELIKYQPSNNLQQAIAKNDFYECYLKNLTKDYNNVTSKNKLSIILDNTELCIKNINNLSSDKSISDNNFLEKVEINQYIKFNDRKNVLNLKDKLLKNSIIYFFLFCLTLSLFVSVNLKKNKK